MIASGLDVHATRMLIDDTKLPTMSDEEQLFPRKTLRLIRGIVTESGNNPRGMMNIYCKPSSFFRQFGHEGCFISILATNPRRFRNWIRMLIEVHILSALQTCSRSSRQHKTQHDSKRTVRLATATTIHTTLFTLTNSFNRSQDEI